MTEKIYVVTDLGPGDGGKGGIVHKVATLTKTHTIVKVGGGQGSHGVSTSRGERFAFSHWGCGTFEGIPTHLSSRIVIIPEGILNEADALRYQYGVHDPFALLTVDEMALCTTHYHGIVSRLKELARGTNPRGTIGTGVGEAYRLAERFPDLVIRARDLLQADLQDVLSAIRTQVIRELEPVLGGDFLPEDREEVRLATNLLKDDAFLNFVVKRFRTLAERIKIVSSDYLGQTILAREGVVVVESSHGILTDCFAGFHPHTSAIRTLPCFTEAMFRGAGYEGPFAHLGVHRAYQYRHGAGPLPTNNPAMLDKLLPGSHKEENRYQGKIRAGALDLNLLRYAIACCGGPSAFQGLAITWFDQIRSNGTWKICGNYKNADDRDFFTLEGQLKVYFGHDDERRLAYQEALSEKLFRCSPEISTIKINDEVSNDKLFDLCAETLEGHLGIPVKMVSFGPTERNKMYR